MSKHSLENYRSDYEQLFKTCTVTQDPSFYVNKIIANRSRYEKIKIVPWYVVGCIHGLEGSFNYNTHLHNGDPLTERTIQVPKGRPLVGNPPFSWEESATDALSMKMPWNDWSVAGTLFFLEKFNGFGYRSKGINSPYLWSFTNHYTKGKYVKDGVYDPTAVSKQCGACAILKRLDAQYNIFNTHIPLPTPQPNVIIDKPKEIVKEERKLNNMELFIKQFSDILSSMFRR